MNRFKRILVYIDKNRDCLEMLQMSLHIAKQNKARLTVISSYQVPQKLDPVFKSVIVSSVVEQENKKNKRELLDIVMDTYRPKYPTIRAKLLEGPDFISVIRHAIRDKSDLLMLSVDKPNFFRDKMFGSMTMHLLRKCPCPVWVFAPSTKKSFKRILAAINTSTTDETEIKMNQKILELSTSLAQQESADLHVLHCWSAFGESILRTMSDLTADEIGKYIRAWGSQYKKMFYKVTDPFFKQTERMVRHYHKGEPRELIPAFTRKYKTDLLVMGTVARTGIPGFIIGNAAEHVLQRVSCSVLTVKPDGFISPVSPTHQVN